MRLPTILFFLLWFSIAAEDARGAEGKRPEMFVLAPTVDDERVYVLVTSAGRYSFVLPHRWSVRYSAELREVTLAGDEGSTITLSFRDQAALPGRADLKEWLPSLQETYPGAKVIDEARLTALSRAVIGFDLEWRHGFGSKTGRFARVPLDRGYLQCSMISLSERFGENLPILMQVMLSLRSGPAGEAAPVRRSSPE